MSTSLATVPASPIPARRGRPKGSGNKRSADLAKYVEATFAGSTPGVQAAQLAMVTPAEIRRARGEARDLGVIDVGLGPAVLAMVVKATKLARALGCDTRDAWLLMQKEREGLMPYIHQKQAPMVDKGQAVALPLVIMMEDGGDQGASIDFADHDADAIEFVDEIPGGAPQVG